MGLLDSVLGSALGKAVPGGAVSKPLMIALGALVVGKMMHHGSGGQKSQAASSGGAAAADGGLLGGVSGLLQKLHSAGHGETAQSWVGNGANQPIQPQHLQQALGSKNISQAAQQAGMSEQELLSQLSTALPGLIDKLTANGKVPSLQEIASVIGQQK